MTAINIQLTQSVSRSMEIPAVPADLGLRIVLVGMAFFTWGILVPYSILAAHH